MDILCILRLARKVQPASVSVTVGGTRASLPWVNHFRHRNVVSSLAIHRCSKHSCVQPMVLFNPWECKHNPRYCILICSLVHLTLDSEKLNDILVKPVANHYRYFRTVENKTSFSLEAALRQANHTQGTAEKLPLSKLALKEYLKCSLSRFFWYWLLPSRLQSSAAA